MSVIELHPGRDTAVDANCELEQALLGAALFAPGEVLRAADPFSPDYFYEAFHGRLWRFIADQVQGGRDGEYVGSAAAHHFRDDPALKDLGGSGYFALLVEHAPMAATAVHFAEALRGLWATRRLGELHGEALLAAREGKPVSDVLAGLRTEVERLESEASPEPTWFVTARDAAMRMLQAKEDDIKNGRVRGAKTGLACFDRRVGGLIPGALIIVGGRPSMGKTALMRSGMYGAAKRQPDKLFAIFSIEMSDEELAERAISESSSADDFMAVTTEKLHKGQCTLEDINRLYDHADQQPDNLIIDARADLSVEDVRRAVWALKRRAEAQGKKLAAVAVDYLQIMRRPLSKGRADHAVIQEITSGLKQLAKQAGICIVLLSQLSRDVEKRDDKRPQLADLRESGAIEQDADAVLLPFREAYYLERAEPKEGSTEHAQWEIDFHGCRRRLEVYLPKNRHGSIGLELQEYDAEYDRIQEWKGPR